MTHEDELRYFYWCCATMHQAGCRVVELGPYVGRSTVALAAGLRRAEPHGKIVSIDRFEWEPWTLENTLGNTINSLTASQRARLRPDQLDPRDRDSFLPLFQIFTEPLKDSIHVVNAELENYQWCGEPIDVLMIDAAKSWSALDQIIREFFPCLVDGAVVIHQDYKHFFTYWLHPVTERMLERGVLTLAENVAGTPTQGFRFRHTPDFRIEDYLQSAFSSAEADRLMARSARRFQGKNERLAVAGARCQLLKSQGFNDRAKLVFQQAMRDGAFTDNYALSDLLMIAEDWARVLIACFLKRDSSSLRSSNIHSVSIPGVCDGRATIVNLPALDVAGGNELVLNFRADRSSNEAMRVRVQLSDSETPTPFYDEEFPIRPGNYQAVTAPLCGRTLINMNWVISSESSPEIHREISCIAPMLLTEA
jgi:hypothetical protein